jgi:two-component system, chemotaxis family, sensor kinase CheA
LNALRQGEAQLTRATTDALLAARDCLGKMLADLREGGLQQYDLTGLIEKLDAAQKTTAKPLPIGELLVQQEVISAATLKEVLKEQSAQPNPPKLGEMLVEKGLASAKQIGDALTRQKQNSPPMAAVPTLRVQAAKLDDLINLIGELVLERNCLQQLSRELSAGNLTDHELSPLFTESASRLSFITEELQSAGLKTRMVPMDTVLRKFPRMVRDIASSLKKEVDLVLVGEDTEVDKTMVELIADPLVHLVRNSLDHAIELPEVREKVGKPRRGTIRLEARQEGDQIAISISDDGAGIDPEKIGRKAVEKGLITSERLRTLSAREILDLIFLPGFSTAEQTTDISGRGVGMDVVRANLKKLNGAIVVESRVGHGTMVKLRLPLTLAIMPVLLVKVIDEIYALPLRSVVETAQIDPRFLHWVEGSEVLCLREETLPLLRLERLFGVDGAYPPQIHTHAEEDACHKVVVLEVAERRIAILVDHLLGQESTVIKSLGSYLHGCPNLAGASVGGDGRVRLVLDPAGLLEHLQIASLTARKASA